MKKIFILFVMGVMAIAVVGQAWGTVPYMINIQGKLTGAGNTPHNFTFQLYSGDPNSGGALIGAPIAVNNVAITNDIFNVQVPFDLSLISFSQPYWIKISADTTPPTTINQQLASVPYAFRSRIAEGLALGTVNIGGIGIAHPTISYDTRGHSGSRAGIIFGANNATNNSMFWMAPDATNGNRFNFGSGLDYDDSTSLLTITNGGNVGIGTTSPTSLLTLKTANADASGGLIHQTVQTQSTTEHRFLTVSRYQLGKLGVSGFQDWTFGVKGGMDPSLIIYNVDRIPAAPVFKQVLTLGFNGHVGIDMPTDNQMPTANLQVVNDMSADVPFDISGDGSNNGTTGYNPAAVQLTDSNNNTKWQISNRGAADGNDRNKLKINYYNGSSAWYNYLTLATNGYIGLGTNNPNSLIDARGQIRAGWYSSATTGAYIRGTASALVVQTDGTAVGSNAAAFYGPIQQIAYKSIGGQGNPLYQIYVNGTDAYQGFGITNINSGGRTLTMNQGSPGQLNFTDPGNIDLCTMDFNTKLFYVKGSSVSQNIGVESADINEKYLTKSKVEDGDVMVITDNDKLDKASVAFDTKVAGIVKKVGGLTLNEKMKDGVPIAYLGKVMANVDASYGEIKPGDLLTTSGTPGYAMKVSDRIKAIGAIVGKALEPLKSGKGKIMVLVTLQ